MATIFDLIGNVTKLKPPGYQPAPTVPEPPTSRPSGRPLPPINASERKPIRAAQDEPPSDPYAVLGLTRFFTYTELRTAYWQTMRKYHADLGEAETLAERARRNRWAVAINAAYEKLTSK